MTTTTPFPPGRAALDAGRDFLHAAAAHLDAAMPPAPDFIPFLALSFSIGLIAAAAFAILAGRPPRGFPFSGERFLSLSAAWAAVILALDAWEASCGGVRVSAWWLAVGPLFLAAVWLGTAFVRIEAAIPYCHKAVTAAFQSLLRRPGRGD